MSDRASTPCPGASRLEAFARGEASDAELDVHIAQCPACDRAVEDIRENEEFLSNFAPAVTAETEPTGGDLLPRDSIPGFRIDGEIHRGGQGVVYRAYDLRAKRDVAIKMLLQGVFASSRQRARFEREIEIAARLKHASIVTLYETGMLPGRRLGYAMEYIDGLPLDKAVRRRWPANDDGSIDTSRETIREKLGLFRRICDAMRYAHEHGVIHRDLKPGNILVDDAGVPHILDFGLAKAVSDAAIGDAVTVTRTGEIFGTLAYAAPEQVTGSAESLDTRCDVHALGVLLYEMLTGELPYELEDSVERIIATLLRTEPRPPREVCPGIDADLETIVLKCLAKDPRRRYASAGGLDQDVERYLANEAIDAKRDSNWYMLRKAIRRHRRFAVAIAGLVCLLATFAIGMAALARKLTVQHERTALLLSASNVERGRGHARANNVAAAEDLIWHELIESVRQSDAPFEELRRNDPSVRHAYWALWELYGIHPCRTTIGVSENARQVATRADGDLLAATDTSGVLHLWRLTSNEVVGAWPGHKEMRRSLRFSPDGRLLAAIREDGAVMFYDADRGIALDALVDDAPYEATAFAFSPSGDRMVIGCIDGRVTTWDIETRTVLRRRHDHEKAVRDLAYGTSDDRITSIDRDRVIVTDQDDIVVDEHLGPVLVALLGLEPDGGPVGGWGGLFLFRVLYISDDRRWETTGHVGDVDSSTGDPVTGRIISGSKDTTIRLWEPTADGLKAGPVLHGHRDAVNNVAAIPGGRGLASSSRDCTIKVWDSDPRRGFRSLAFPKLTTHDLAIDARGERLATASESGAIELRDARTGELVRSFAGHDDVASSVAFMDDGLRLVSTAYDHTVRIWNTATGLCERAWTAHDDTVHDVAVSPDGSTLATSGRDRMIRLWSVRDGSLLAELAGHEDRIPQVLFTPTGDALISTDVAGVVRKWDLTTAQPGSVSSELRSSGVPARSIAIGPAGRLLAVGTDAGRLELYDLAMGERIDDLGAHGANIFGLTFSSDGRYLASAARDGTVKLWDVARRRELAVLLPSQGSRMVFDVAFTDDDCTLLVCGSAGLLGRIDLTYNERLIAGNVEYRLQQMGTTAPKLQAWARNVLSRERE